MAYGFTATGWRSRCATEVMINVNGTSFLRTGSDLAGRTLLEGKVGLAPMPPLNFKIGLPRYNGVPGEYLFPYSTFAHRAHSTFGTRAT